MNDKPKNKLFVWDELENEIQEREPEELFECNAEGGWTSETFLHDENGNAVEVRTTGRHYGLETWAPNLKAARIRFREVSLIYRKYQE